MVISDVDGGADALVGLGRWHADVDYCELGFVRGDGGEKALGIVDGGDDVDAVVS